MANPNMIVGAPSVNPRGKPPSIFQDLPYRREHFLKTLTRSEILTIAASDERLDEYSSFDAQVLIGLADTLKRTPEEKLDPSHERERLYDRSIGKAAQTVNVDHSGSVTVFSVDVSPLAGFIEEETARGTETIVQAVLPERSVLPAPIRPET